jgi:hypothetical protein
MARSFWSRFSGKSVDKIANPNRLRRLGARGIIWVPNRRSRLGWLNAVRRDFVDAFPWKDARKGPSNVFLIMNSLVSRSQTTLNDGIPPFTPS